MNKKNQTLLIALSIILIISISLCSIIFLKSEKEIVKISEVTECQAIKTEPALIEVTFAAEVKKLTTEEIAKQVLAGEWGNGSERKIKVENAGYNYQEIQKKIEELTTPPKPKVEVSIAAAPIKIPEGEYSYARQIWNIMRSWGWTPETCAGIIGNMMAEVGGGTLDLSRWNTSGCGYGLIQWTSGRAAAIKNRYGAFPNIEQQLQFVKDELFGTNNTRQQVSNINLNIIMNVDKNQTPESIAMCFASYYERCGQAYRARRQRFARTAYEYFINK